MKYLELLENFSPADILQIENNVANMFATKGITFSFSSHFFTRMDQRLSGLTRDDVEKVFFVIFSNDAITKAFEVFSKDDQVTQDSRSIDFTNLNGKVGSIQINKLGKKNFQAETLFYGSYLTQGVRGLDPQETIKALHRANSSGHKLMPTYRLGPIPKESLADLKRRSREPVNPETGVNRHGYSQSVPNSRVSNVMDLVSTSVLSLLEESNKVFKKIGSEFSAAQGLVIFSKVLEAIKLMRNLNIISDASITNPIDGTNFITGDLANTISRLTSRARVNDNTAFTAGAVDKIRAITAHMDKNIQRDVGIKKSEFSKELPLYYRYLQAGDTDSSEFKSLAQSLSEQIKPFIEYANEYDLLHKSMYGTERQSTDELGTQLNYMINPVTGNISLDQESSKQRSNSMAKGLVDYYKTHGINALTVIQNAKQDIDNKVSELLGNPNSEDPQEKDIRNSLAELTNQLKNNDITNALEYLQLLLSEKLQGEQTPFKQAFFDPRFTDTLNKNLKRLSPGYTEKLNTSFKNLSEYTAKGLSMPESSKNHEFQTYVNILLADLADPDNPNKFNADDDEQWARQQGTLPPLYDPIDQIPPEHRKEAKERAFEIILDKMKSDPNFVNMVEDNARWLKEWIPDSIYRKLVNLGHEINLDDLDTKMRDSASQEKFIGRVKHRGLPKPRTRYNESQQALQRLKHLSGLL